MAARKLVRTNLRRSTEQRTPRRVVKIYSEGRVTEPQYFTALKRLPTVRERIALDIRPDAAGCAPLTLVQRAVAAKNEEAEVDDIWCVFDVEAKADRPGHHPNLSEARRLAQEGGVHVALSNPCFELWLALHHERGDRTAHLTTADAVALRRDLDGSTGKEVDTASYVTHLQRAVDRAIALERKHVLDGTPFPHDNPSSGVYKLIVAIDAAYLTTPSR